MAMTHSRALRIVSALRAHDLGHLLLHQLAQHTEPDPDAQRQQPLLRGTDQLAQRLLHTRRQRRGALISGRDLRDRYGLLQRRFLLRSWLITPNAATSSGRGRRDRRLKFYGLRDNLTELASSATGLCPAPRLRVDSF